MGDPSTIGPLDIIRAAQWLPLEAPEKAVLIAMVTSARMSHAAWVGNPSVAALAMASGYKHRRVQMALGSLANARLVTRTDKAKGGDGASEWRVEAFRIVDAARSFRAADVCGVHGLEGCITCTGARHAYAPVEQREYISPTDAGAPHAPVHHMHPNKVKTEPGDTPDPARHESCEAPRTELPRPDFENAAKKRTQPPADPEPGLVAPYRPNLGDGTSPFFAGAGRPKPERARNGVNLTGLNVEPVFVRGVPTFKDHNHAARTSRRGAPEHVLMALAWIYWRGTRDGEEVSVEEEARMLAEKYGPRWEAYERDH